jgi:hypothetical protein
MFSKDATSEQSASELRGRRGNERTLEIRSQIQLALQVCDPVPVLDVGFRAQIAKAGIGTVSETARSWTGDSPSQGVL